jgi:putative sugar O-methyltransferase
LAELEPRVLDGPVVVVDLGAGWGRIGHVLKRVNPQAAYVVLDLPESLLVSEARLTELLPGERVAGYDESRRTEWFTREALLAHGGLRFGGPQDLARFEDGAIDVFVNVASFQEMTREQVTAYLGLADRTARHVYLQERWTRASALPEEIIAGWDAYELPERWRRRYLRDVPFTNAFFEAGFDTGQG